GQPRPSVVGVRPDLEPDQDPEVLRLRLGRRRLQDPGRKGRVVAVTFRDKQTDFEKVQALLIASKACSFLDLPSRLMPRPIYEAIAMPRIHRIDSPSRLDPAEIASCIAAGSQVVVQFSHSNFPSTVAKTLNELSPLHGRKLTIRFYGHYSQVFDGDVLHQFPQA